MQVGGSVVHTNRLLMISGQNSTINVVEAVNTSNATLASVTLDSASVEGQNSQRCSHRITIRRILIVPHCDRERKLYFGTVLK